MEKIENKMKNYEAKIKSRQNIALLIESINSLGDYQGIDYVFKLNKEHRIRFDMANNLFSMLFDDLRDFLIQEKFIINLNNQKIDFIRDDLELLTEINPMLRTEISTLYENVRDSFAVLKDILKEDEVNIIELLLKNGKIEKVLELFVLKSVPPTIKFDIFKTIIEIYPNKVKDIFKMLPEKYSYYCNLNGIDGKRYFQQLLNNNLLETVNSNYSIDTIRTYMKMECPDEVTKFKIKYLVEFFVEHNLVDMNDIEWMYNGSSVTSAAAGYILGNKYLGEYLYSLQSYKQVAPEVKCDSDKAILKILLKNDNEFEKFIQHINYENTPEKLRHIMKIILELQPMHPNIIDKQRLDTIINILLRKTKKNDYKEMKQVIVEMKTNVDIQLLNEKRQEFNGKLRIVNDALLEQVPATTQIRDLQFIKTNN